MERNCRAIAVTLVALMLMIGVCSGLVFLLAGDAILDAGRGFVANLALLGREDDLNATVSDDETPIRFIVNLGDTPAVIAQNLVNTGLITDAELFMDYVRARGIATQLEAGIFLLNQAQTIPDIAQDLMESRYSQITLLIPEGWRLEQVVESIDANPLFGFSGADFAAVVGQGAFVDTVFASRVGMPEGVSLEGFLFPATYNFPPNITPEGVRDELLRTFFLNVDETIIQDATAQGLSIYEVVTLASIVEREALHADEKPLIAGVYRNRLNIGMKLDADPTVQYALGNSRGTWWARITVADYQGVVSPYNTYIYTGFPPGPIASPGLAAIRAVVYPEASEYFFFRADCRTDGYHEFARTYEEHLANGC